VKANKFRVFLDYVMFNHDGDGAWNHGENNFKVWVNDGSEHVMVSDYVEATSGDVFEQDKLLDIIMPQEVGAKFTVGFWANDEDPDEADEATATNVHAFDFESASWEDVTTGLTLHNKGDRLEVTVGYNVELIE
jgi:hypothetical protein